MKKNIVTKIGVVFAVLVALGMISCATAIPLTASESYTKARNDSTDILEKITTFKTIVNFDKMQNYLNKKVPSDVGALITEKVNNFTNEKIVTYLEQYKDIWGQETYDEVLAFLIEWSLFFVEIGLSLFGHNFVGYFIGAVIAWIVLTIPKMVLCGLVTVSGILDFISNAGIDWNSLVFQFGVIGAFLFYLLFIPITSLVGFPIAYIGYYILLLNDVMTEMPYPW